MRNDEKPCHPHGATYCRECGYPAPPVAGETPTVRIGDETYFLDPNYLRRAGDAMVGHLHVDV